MKKRKLYLVLSIVTALSVSFILYNSCGKSMSDIEICAPMQEFLEIIANPRKSPVEALEKFASSSELIKHDIAYYNVSSPEVILAEKDFYKVRMQNGVTVREFDFYWEDNKIMEIVDHGIIR